MYDFLKIDGFILYPDKKGTFGTVQVSWSWDEAVQYGKELKAYIDGYGILVEIWYHQWSDYPFSYDLMVKPLSEDDKHMLLMQFGGDFDATKY